MTWLSEDPWPLAGSCFVVAFGFLVALRLSQQGKYLVWGGVAAGLGLLVLAVEWLWVTDRERIEHVVHDMAAAVKRGDFDRFESHLSTEFDVPGGAITRAMVRGRLEGVEFEFLRIARLDVEVAPQARRGKADFLAQAQWRETTAHGGTNFDATPPPGVGFSVGFAEVEPEVWKVTRIDVTSTPSGVSPDSVRDYLGRGAG